MRKRFGKWVFIWEGRWPRVVRYVNLAEWRRKSNFFDAAMKAADLDDEGKEKPTKRR